MKRIAHTMIAASVAIALLFVAGCALVNPTPGSLQDTVAAITIWTDFVQPAIKTYGNWPDCVPEKPLVKLCRDHAFFTTKVQPTAWAAHMAIQAAGPVLAGQVPDTGQISAAYDAIQAARATMAQTPVAVPATATGS